MSNAIKYWREKYRDKNNKKMTQEELANLIGIDRPTLSKIENPNIPIDPDENMALKISRYLEVLITDILSKPPEK